MNRLLAVTIAGGVALTALSSANAADGCGRGFHRGPYGHCRSNGPPPRVVAGPPLVIGTYYRGHGYWDGNRYWRHRQRWNGGWRYR